MASRMGGVAMGKYAPSAGTNDRQHVELTGPHDLEYWSAQLGAELPAIETAVRAVGTNVVEVSAWLVMHRRRRFAEPLDARISPTPVPEP
jgi:hypothetical protein